MKRFLSVFITISILLTFTVTALATNDGAKLVCSTQNMTVKPGEEITISISVENAKKAKSLALLFDYDVVNAFEVPSSDAGHWSMSGALLSDFSISKTQCGAAAIAFSTEQNFNSDVFSITLKVKDNASIGETTINVTPTLKNGTTTIECKASTLKINISKVDITQERRIEYTIESIALKDLSFNTIEKIPNGKFFAEVKVTNNLSTCSDIIILSSYDKSGKMLGLQYLLSNPKIGDSVTLGTSIDNSNGEIAKLKAFVLPTYGSAVPLAEAVEFGHTATS